MYMYVPLTCYNIGTPWTVDTLGNLFCVLDTLWRPQLGHAYCELKVSRPTYGLNAAMPCRRAPHAELYACGVHRFLGYRQLDFRMQTTQPVAVACSLGSVRNGGVDRGRRSRFNISESHTLLPRLNLMKE